MAKIFLVRWVTGGHTIPGQSTQGFSHRTQHAHSPQVRETKCLRRTELRFGLYSMALLRLSLLQSLQDLFHCFMQERIFFLRSAKQSGLDEPSAQKFLNHSDKKCSSHSPVPVQFCSQTLNHLLLDTNFNILSSDIGILCQKKLRRFCNLCEFFLLFCVHTNPPMSYFQTRGDTEKNS